MSTIAVPLFVSNCRVHQEITRRIIMSILFSRSQGSVLTVKMSLHHAGGVAVMSFHCCSMEGAGMFSV